MSGQPSGIRADLRRVSIRIGALVLAVSLANLGGLAWFWEDRDLSIHVLRPAQTANDRMMNGVVAAQSAMRGYAATGDRGLLEEKTYPDAKFRTDVRALRERDSGIPDDLLAKQEQALETWLDFRRGIVERLDRGEDVAAAIPRTPFPEVRAANEDVRQWYTKRITETSGRISAVVITTAAGFALGMLLTIGLLLRLRAHVLSDIITPLVRLRQVVSLRDGRARTDVGPAEIRALAGVVNEHLDVTERAAQEAALEHRLNVVKDETALAVRQSLSEQTVLDELQDGLRAAFPDGTARVVGPGEEDALWLAQELTEERVSVVDGTASHARLTAFVRSEEGPAALALVTRQQPRTWHPREVQLLEQLCDYATRGVDQARFDASRAQTITRLEALDRQKSDFVATISHELRTPLTSISGYLELLEDGDYGDLTPGQSQVLGIVDRNTTRLRSLIEDLLVLSKIEANGVDLDVTSFDLALLADVVAENLGPQAAAAGVAIIRDDGVVGEEALVTGDVAQVERALTNIIGNAVKFTPGGGTVHVGVDRAPTGHQVVVADSGIGIPAEDIEDIGRRFFRASNVTAQTIPGTGLGLSIVRAIAEAHRGRLDVASQAGVGTTVTLTLGRPAAP